MFFASKYANIKTSFSSILYYHHSPAIKILLHLPGVILLLRLKKTTFNYVKSMNLNFIFAG